MATQSNGSSLLVQGRLVWITGKTLFEGQQKKDFNTNQELFDNMGNPVVEYGFGLAVPHNTEEFTKLWEALHAEAFTLYPNGQIPPGFAMKFKDGNGIDHKGVNFSEREGYKDHLILTCVTRIPVKYFIHDGVNNILVNDGIKNGDYVNVQLNIKAHPAKGTGKAGLYVNPSAVQLIQSGKEIINTPSGDAIFANANMAYAGQMVADTAPAMPNMGQQAPVMPSMAPAAPAQQAPAQQAPAQQAPAHYGVVPQNLQPPQQPMGNAPAAPVMPPTGAMAPQQAPTSAPPAPSSNGMMAPPMPGQA